MSGLCFKPDLCHFHRLHRRGRPGPDGRRGHDRLTYLTERGRYSVAYEARGAQYAGVPAPREASLGLFRMLTERLALKGSFILGLNNGSPRTSFGVGVVYWPK